MPALGIPSRHSGISETGEKIGGAIAEGVIRRDLGASMVVAQALWASIHGLVVLFTPPGTARGEEARLLRDFLTNHLVGFSGL